MEVRAVADEYYGIPENPQYSAQITFFLVFCNGYGRNTICLRYYLHHGILFSFY